MRKLIFVLIAALSVALTGCSFFESAPIEPNIIGSGVVNLDDKSGTYFVAIDSMQYTVANVTIPDYNPRSLSKTQNIEPVEGMLVTIFTSRTNVGVQAVTNKQSVEQIEELYHTNDAGTVMVFVLIILCVLGIALLSKTK